MSWSRRAETARRKVMSPNLESRPHSFKRFGIECRREAVEAFSVHAKSLGPSVGFWVIGAGCSPVQRPAGETIPNQEDFRSAEEGVSATKRFLHRECRVCGFPAMLFGCVGIDILRGDLGVSLQSDDRTGGDCLRQVDFSKLLSGKTCQSFVKVGCQSNTSVSFR